MFTLSVRTQRILLVVLALSITALASLAVLHAVHLDTSFINRHVLQSFINRHAPVADILQIIHRH